MAQPTTRGSSRLIIGVDPGKSTGLAWLIDDTFQSIDLPAIKACTLLDMIMREYDSDKSVIRSDQVAVIAVERYNITAQTSKLTRQYDALEVIGVCRWLAHAHGAQFMLQGASSAQRCGNREVLQALGWWKPGGDHLNKAAAQVALACQTIFPHEFAQRIEPGMII